MYNGQGIEYTNWSARGAELNSSGLNYSKYTGRVLHISDRILFASGQIGNCVSLAIFRSLTANQIFHKIHYFITLDYQTSK